MRARICFLGLVCVCVGCRDLEGPATGEILANLSTTTDPQDRDANGYILQVEGRDPHSVPVNSIVKIGPLEPGTYRVTLDGLAPNCSVNGPNPVTIRHSTVTSTATTATRTSSLSVWPGHSTLGSSREEYLTLRGSRGADDDPQAE